MANTDNYIFHKSCLPQGVDEETPYVSKQWNYLNDINSGVYSNSGLSLCQFDLSSIYNSSQLISISESYITIPITYVTTFVSSAGALVAPSASSWASTGLKMGYTQLIHGVDLTINGKSVEQFQPNLNAYVNVKLLSTMSQDDLANLGTSLGFGDKIDNFESMVFNMSGAVNVASGNIGTTACVLSKAAGSVTAATQGNGVVNNAPFGLSGYSNQGDQSASGVQFGNAYNNGLFSRLKKFVDTSSNSANGIVSSSGTTGITSLSNLQKEFKPYYVVANTNYAVWYDVAVVRCCDILDCLKNYPLSRKFDGVLRMYINVGSVVSSITGGTGLTAATNFMATSASLITFTNTCPLIQTAQASNPTATAQASALFIGSPTATSITANGLSINMAASGASHFMNACRFYYAQVTLKPERLDWYISNNRSKQITWTSILTNTFAGIGAGTSVSYLVQSGVTAVKGVWILPFISASTNGLITTATSSYQVLPFAQALSPFDTATGAPISLLNLQVSIGGVNVLSNTLNFSYENFLEQINDYEKINGQEMGLSCGLISQDWYEYNRMYYVNCERAQLADTMTPRNVNVTFTNNSLQTIDCLIFTEYVRTAVLDVDTGIINV